MTSTSTAFTVVTGRYNNETWDATVRYRERKKLTCIYAPACRLSSSILCNAPVFVIEMNNQLNIVMGIGLIKNKLVTDRVYKVQADTNCNRYIYIGQHHLPRELLSEYSPFLVFVLDQILFKGKTHSKRGIGLTRIPEKVLKFDICEDVDIKKEIRNVFVHHYKKQKTRTELNEDEN
jgi:hypothetical protein